MNKKNKSVSPAPSANLLDEVKETSAYWDEDGTTTIGRATQYAEMGRFQILLLIVCLFAYSNISTFPNILTKASGAIQCDYQLIKEDRKAINDVVYVCMIVGGAAWSLLADTISRKWTLILVLLVYTVSTIAFASANTFLLLGVFRGISAFSRSGIICITITFIAEFQISYFRGSMICCLQLAWIIGMVGIPSLPFAYKSLIIIGTIPAIIAMVGLIFFPDSPRFLLSRGREREAIRSLQMIHAFNTGTTKVNFPIRHLEDNRTAEDIRRNSVVKAFIPEHLEPKFVCIPIVMLAQLALMFSYYTLSLWFPYMVARSEAFFPLARVEDIPQDCKTGLYYKRQDTYVMNPLIYMGGNNLENGTLRIMPFTGQERKQLENPCSQDDRKLFDRRSSTMDALVCMPSLIWLVVKIDTMGRKFFMTFAHVIAGCLAFASYFMHNIGRELLFSCLFDSVTLLSIGVSSCLAVELFSTRVRVLGVALVIGAGQLGTILADIGGAISFGLTCVVVVALIANALAITGILIMTLPDTTGISLR